MEPSVFREYSIRGVVPRELDASAMHLLGQSLGTYVLGQGGRSVVVGHDVRLHSPSLCEALVEGVCQAGADVVHVGLAPTPVINFATDLLGADAGAAVTASHNPPEYNGLKIRTDQTLQGRELLRLRDLAQDGPLSRGQGRAQRAQVLETYLGAVASRVRGDLGLRVVVDGGNGTNGSLVQTLLARLGCEALLLHGEPDGHFPHRSPNPLAPGSLDKLQQVVRSQGADLGVAYDGDGDRLVVVDEQGGVVWADRLLALLARAVLKQKPGAKIIYDISSSQALVDDVLAHGGVPVPSPVGYALVHRRMKEVGALLAGEMAGHLFFADSQFRFDDAILGTAKVVEVVARADCPLSALVAELPAYHTSPETRVFCPDDQKESVVTALAQVYDGQRPLETLDGVRVSFDDGWGLVRASQTQQAISMRFEARTPEELAAIQDEMVSHLRELLQPIEWRLI